MYKPKEIKMVACQDDETIFYKESKSINEFRLNFVKKGRPRKTKYVMCLVKFELVK